ncbi:hypothetical protein, partial [Massilia sp. DWR3-1-1]|uniref:hypothetical protein n=1 Tax=Massilia sp. DWR3-1-1 TaxID=2804559 RepID=UPI003CF05A6A
EFPHTPRWVSRLLRKAAIFSNRCISFQSLLCISLQPLLTLDEFCALAGVGKLSGEGMRRLLTEGQRVLGCIEFVDTGARDKKDMPWGSSPMFGFVSADDERVSFEVFNFVLHDYVLCRVLALTPTQRQ